MAEGSIAGRKNKMEAVKFCKEQRGKEVWWASKLLFKMVPLLAS